MRLVTTHTQRNIQTKYLKYKYHNGLSIFKGYLPHHEVINITLQLFVYYGWGIYYLT